MPYNYLQMINVYNVANPKRVFKKLNVLFCFFRNTLSQLEELTRMIDMLIELSILVLRLINN